MNCIVELKQLQKPQNKIYITHPIFSVDPITIHYEVHYFRNNLYMNLGSYRLLESDLRLPLRINPDFRRTIFTDLFSSKTLIPESQFDSIINTLSSKATSISFDHRNFGYNYIPVSLSIRVIWLQHYTADVRRAWDRMLHPVGREFSVKIPATQKSIQDLETAFYDGEEEEEDNGRGVGRECPICLEKFKIGEKITRMPCFHYYHRDCIVMCLEKNHLCPSCRFPMPVCDPVAEGAFPFYKRIHYDGDKISMSTSRYEIVYFTSLGAARKTKDGIIRPSV